MLVAVCDSRLVKGFIKVARADELLRPDNESPANFLVTGASRICAHVDDESTVRLFEQAELARAVMDKARASSGT